ncbi:MAG: glycosyl hydrolase family 18 protein [Cellulosilyticaceae bacterium]
MKRTLRKVVTSTVAFLMAASNLGVAGVNVYAAETPRIELSEEKQLERKIVGYFPEWAYAIEEQGYYMVTDLQWDYLTHIQYSFGMVDPATNKITFGDKKAAIEEDFSDRTIMHKGKEVKLDPTLPYKGHFNLMQVMKKQYPDVTLLMSVGGWAGSRGFYTMLDTDAGIETFANSCVDFIRQYGFDGIDIDFEYPSATGTCGNPDDADLSEPRRAKLNERYNVMMEVLRDKLDEAAKQDGKYYYLTAAVTASSWVLGGMSSHDFVDNLDFLSVMSYDFHGGWNEFVENLANIYPDPADKETANMKMPTLCMDWAYRYYRGALPSEKILMGIPYYTRGWENVQGGTNGLHGTSKTPATGKYNIWGDDDNKDGQKDPAGANPLWHVKNLLEEDANFNRYWDNTGKVPYVWQDKEKVFLSYEDEQSIDERVKYINDKNLGGALIWVMNGDYGPNPNYVPGSTNVNEGKYTYGDTLTKRLSEGFDKIGASKKSPDDPIIEPIVEVDLDFTGKYDHPNYVYNIMVKNNTGAEIKGGWTVGFDLPKSAVYGGSWSGNATVKDAGEFNRVTITSGAWNNIAAGATAKLEGSITLAFSDIRNVTFNGCTPRSHVKENAVPKPIAARIGVDKPQVFEKETYNLSVNIPANSGAVKYQVLEDNNVIREGAVTAAAQNFTMPVTKPTAGNFTYKVRLVNAQNGMVDSNLVGVKVIELGKPLFPQVSTNKQKVVLGEEYTIKLEVPGNSFGRSYQVLEGTQVIRSGAVTQEALTVEIPVKKTVKGSYQYTAKLINEKGETTGNMVSVDVDEVKPLAATVSVDKTEVVAKDTYTVSVAIPANSMAAAYTVLENGAAIKSGAVTAAANNFTILVKKDAKGTYSYQVKLTGPQGNVDSNTVTVKVNEEGKPLAATVSVNKSEVEAKEAYTVSVAIPANSMAASYTVLENGASIKTGAVTAAANNFTIPVTKDAKGTYSYQVKLTGPQGAMDSNTVSVTVKEAAVAMPKQPSLSATAVTEGSYSVSGSVPAQSAATSYTLYENGTAIKTGSVNPTATSTTAVNQSFTNKAAGTYQYQLEVSNAAGTAVSSTVTVVVEKVTPPEPTNKPGTPQIKQDRWNGEATYTIGFDMYYGQNGTEWKLYENGSLIHSASLADKTPAAQNGTYQITQTANGAYEYYVELVNKGGVSTSNKITVNVTQASTSGGGGGTPAAAPATPVVAHNNWNNLPNYSITFNMWWGENGTEWKLYENGAQVHSASLSANGQSAQSGSVNFSGKAPGTYTYYVELINGAGASTSNEVTVTVN